MYDFINKKIVFYSLINGVGSSTMAYHLSRLLRLPLYQEQKNDLVFFLKKKLDSVRYTVKQLDEINEDDYSEGAVYDLKNTNTKIFSLATDIVVLTNNSYLDILKTIATLQKVQSLLFDKKKPVHVIFNRLQNGNVNREKRYTNVSKQLILSNVKDMNISFSYIRANLIYYRGISEGHFFMDSFFKRNEDLLQDYPEIIEMSHIDYLEMFYDYQYEDTPYDFRLFKTSYERLYKDRIKLANEYNETLKINTKQRKNTPDGINEEIAKLNFNQENMRLSKVSIRDMYSFLYKIGIYDNKMYECNECKNNLKCWKAELRRANEDKRKKKSLNNNYRCKTIRERIQED